MATKPSGGPVDVRRDVRRADVRRTKATDRGGAGRVVRSTLIEYTNPAQMFREAEALLEDWAPLKVFLGRTRTPPALILVLEYGVNDRGDALFVEVHLKPRDLPSLAAYLLHRFPDATVVVIADVPDDTDPDPTDVGAARRRTSNDTRTEQHDDVRADDSPTE